MSVPAVYAVFKRLAAEKNEWPGEWRDTSIRGDSEEEVRAKWRALPRSETDWQESEVRLVPAQEDRFRDLANKGAEDPGEAHYADAAYRCKRCGSAELQSHGIGCEVFRHSCKTCGADPA